MRFYLVPPYCIVVLLALCFEIALTVPSVRGGAPRPRPEILRSSKPTDTEVLHGIILYQNIKSFTTLIILSIRTF
ncbi:hypothetical protein BJ508DRAFT_128638 [Ascobolus immersus RN42]|uniref:Uncharacterized protein n=1 Tax=Ascobolus immersus RN42 TaxID=1160509 RepID=A0A3N4IFX9_ASCIM|nr:hypothetical protein BJ508DRAFT_128638 [Ascobolus immersus RN42]